MFALKARSVSAKSFGAAPGLMLASLALVAAGCAEDTSSYTVSPAVAGYVAQADRIEMEADGLPAQAPPAARIRQMPDDPAEPYSRNYGGRNPASGLENSAASRSQAAAQPYLPADLPPDFRIKLTVATGGEQ